VNTPASSPQGLPDRPDLNLVKFDRLYTTHFQEIYAYVARRRPGHEVPDLVAEVFATTWRRIDDVPPSPEDRLWLYGVARRNLSQDDRATYRRHALISRLVQTRSSPLEHSDADESDSLAFLRELIGHLKPLDQEVVRLVAWESLTHDEVAQVLGCSANAVTIRWHRSIGRLRKAFPAPQKEDNGGD
jgi:RNA polymerase sigma factor (sigma-70 family)